MRSVKIVLYILTLIFISLFIYTATALSETTPGKQKTKFKILYIMSYHSPWRWTDGQLQGFREGLELDAEYKIFQMDAKQYNSAAAKEKKGREARNLIKTWKPDLIYTTDDDAQEYVTKYYINDDLPFVFSGVNKDPAAYGFDKSSNITGVLEQEHFSESLNLLKAIKPDVKKIAAVFDDAAMWDPVKERMREKIKQFPGIEIVYWDTISAFDEYKNRIKEYQKNADAIALIGIFNFKGKNGKNTPYQEVLKWTAENSNLPDFSYWIDRVYYGTLCSVTVSELEQGLAAGQIARSILSEKKSPSGFPIKPTVRGTAVISLARANKLGIKIKSGLLLSSEIIEKFEWEK